MTDSCHSHASLVGQVAENSEWVLSKFPVRIDDVMFTDVTDHFSYPAACFRELDMNGNVWVKRHGGIYCPARVVTSVREVGWRDLQIMLGISNHTFRKWRISIEQPSDFCGQGNGDRTWEVKGLANINRHWKRKKTEAPTSHLSRLSLSPLGSGIKATEFMFAGINMIWATLSLVLPRAVSRGLKRALEGHKIYLIYLIKRPLKEFLGLNETRPT